MPPGRARGFAGPLGCCECRQRGESGPLRYAMQPGEDLRTFRQIFGFFVVLEKTLALMGMYFERGLSGPACMSFRSRFGLGLRGRIEKESRCKKAFCRSRWCRICSRKCPFRYRRADRRTMRVRLISFRALQAMSAAVLEIGNAPAGQICPLARHSMAVLRAARFPGRSLEKFAFCGCMNALNARSTFSIALEILPPYPPIRLVRLITEPPERLVLQERKKRKSRTKPAAIHTANARMIAGAGKAHHSAPDGKASKAPAQMPEGPGRPAGGHQRCDLSIL
jgi:hypothetical protein